MLSVRGPCRQLLLSSELVAVQTPGPILHIVLRMVRRTVAMEFRLFVAVHAKHPFLVMNIGAPAVFAHKLGIHPSAVAESTGLALVSGNKPMPLNQTCAETAYCRTFHMAVPARRVAAPAGLLENLFIKYFRLRCREPSHDTVSLTGGCVMERLPVIGRDLSVAGAADLHVFRRPFDETRMSGFLARTGFIALVAKSASQSEMRVFPD